MRRYMRADSVPGKSHNPIDNKQEDQNPHLECLRVQADYFCRKQNELGRFSADRQVE